MLLYDQVFQILSNKIECGLLPAGASLPSRADLCREFGASEKTIRRALAMLEEKGLIETEQRKRPVVSPRRNAGHETTLHALEKIDRDVTSDVLKTGVLLCYPAIRRGISLCAQADLEIPGRILDNMEPGNAPEFWKLSKQFYRFFIARNENSLLLQAVDSLGLAGLRPLRDDMTVRTRYYGQLRAFMRTIEAGGAPESVRFDDMSGAYGLEEGACPALRAAPDSAVLLGKKQLEKLLQVSEVRYSAVYMDIMGLIAAGYYRRGDQLPTHKELRKIYGVSVDTTIKAIQILQKWGVVKAVRGNGIFVEMDRKEIQRIRVPAHLIAYQVRRYLDTLELLALTVEGAAACAAARVSQEEVRAARAKIERLWSEEYVYERTPAVLLELISGNTGIEALGAIYELLQKNFRIGRSIPGLLNTKKTALNRAIHAQCLEVLDALGDGQAGAFAQKAVRLFERIEAMVAEECRRLGYYEAAAGAYDGTALWK